jgi:protocatechuate 3,4-dioxygenase beta subunit
LAGATIDIWQCDAFGVYSDASDPGFSTLGRQFLRGYQVTDASGLAQFTTIYPGWYDGRAVHIHFKIRSTDATGSSFEFTSQFFFDEGITDLAHAVEPYASTGQRTILNDDDGIYRDGGDQLVLTVAEAADGYLGTFDIGVQIG